ncbi:Rho guanine nucleotide exchange factor [Marasmius sp. AFHP31]|nr:Rho guanine nucleotide exchange factor [Marasmius sp. AFHP31]
MSPPIPKLPGMITKNMTDLLSMPGPGGQANQIRRVNSQSSMTSDMTSNTLGLGMGQSIVNTSMGIGINPGIPPNPMRQDGQPMTGKPQMAMRGHMQQPEGSISKSRPNPAMNNQNIIESTTPPLMGSLNPPSSSSLPQNSMAGVPPQRNDFQNPPHPPHLSSSPRPGLTASVGITGSGSSQNSVTRRGPRAPFIPHRDHRNPHGGPQNNRIPNGNYPLIPKTPPPDQIDMSGSLDNTPDSAANHSNFIAWQPGEMYLTKNIDPFDPREDFDPYGLNQGQNENGVPSHPPPHSPNRPAHSPRAPSTIHRQSPSHHDEGMNIYPAWPQSQSQKIYVGRPPSSQAPRPGSLSPPSPKYSTSMPRYQRPHAPQVSSAESRIPYQNTGGSVGPTSRPSLQTELWPSSANPRPRLLSGRRSTSLFIETMESSQMKATALNYDEEVKLLGDIISNEQRRKKVLATTGVKAQEWLDSMQLDVEMLGDDPIGGGAFGDVWKGRRGKSIVCMKVLRVFTQAEVEQALKDYMREAIVWRQLDHPNLLPFLGIYYMNDTRKRLCLVSPWMERGNLVQFMKEAPELVDPKSLVNDVARGLSHLHDNKIVHGDLKGVNVLVTPDLRACIGDFGLSRVTDTLKLFSVQTNRSKGTMRWLAPELIQPDSEVESSRESDVYAYAGVCLEIFTGRLPFSELNDAQVMFAVLIHKKHPARPTDSPGLRDDMWSLMMRCWDANPSSRPTMADILQQLSPVEPGDLQKQSEATAFPSHQEGSNGSVGGRKRPREDDEAKHSSNGAGSAMVTASAAQSSQANGSGNRPPQLKKFKSQWDETPSGGELTNEEFAFGSKLDKLSDPLSSSHRLHRYIDSNAADAVPPSHYSAHALLGSLEFQSALRRRRSGHVQGNRPLTSLVSGCIFEKS